MRLRSFGSGMRSVGGGGRGFEVCREETLPNPPLSVPGLGRHSTSSLTSSRNTSRFPPLSVPLPV